MTLSNTSPNHTWTSTLDVGEKKKEKENKKEIVTIQMLRIRVKVFVKKIGVAFFCHI